jgi:hypothetical protein
VTDDGDAADIDVDAFRNLSPGNGHRTWRPLSAGRSAPRPAAATGPETPAGPPGSDVPADPPAPAVPQSDPPKVATQ